MICTYPQVIFIQIRRKGGCKLEGVFVIQAHSSAGSESPCGRPGRVSSIYFLTRPVFSLKFALTMLCVTIKFSFWASSPKPCILGYKLLYKSYINVMIANILIYRRSLSELPGPRYKFCHPETAKSQKIFK